MYWPQLTAGQILDKLIFLIWVQGLCIDHVGEVEELDDAKYIERTGVSYPAPISEGVMDRPALQHAWPDRRYDCGSPC